VDKEALKQVKVTRADVVKKLVADEKAAAKAAVETSQQALDAARIAFYKVAAETVFVAYEDTLRKLLEAVGTNSSNLVPEVHYELYERDEQPPSDSVAVTFRDGEKWTCNFGVRLVRKLTPVLMDMRDAWAARLVEHAAARDRDLRVGAVAADVRGALIKAALDETDEGREVLAAMKRLREAMKDG
jgi:hypothetical protein